MPEGLTPLDAFLTTNDLWWLVYPGYGFDFFGPEHLIWLAFIVLAAGLVIGAYRRMPHDFSWRSPRRKVLLALAGIPVVCWTIVTVLTIDQGMLKVSRLPLYLCNLCEALLVIDALHPNRFCDESIFAIGLAGGGAALLFPGWTCCPAWSLPSVTGFIEHSCIVIFAILRIVDGDFRPSARNIWQPMLLTLAYTALIIPLNIACGTNFMFVPDPYEAQPLKALFETLGNPAYTLVYLAGVFAIFAAEYALAFTLTRKSRHAHIAQ